MNNLIRHSILGAGLMAVALASPAEEGDAAGCSHSVDSVPQSIRAILSPLYADASAEDGLKQASRDLETLMNEANYCRVVIQSVEYTDGNKQRDLREWHSLNQWLYRLTNFVGLNANGDMAHDWKAEYELFVEVYELEI